MAVARPIRMLGAASIVLCLFLIFQLNKGPTPLLRHQGKLSSMKSDPLLQRVLFPFSPVAFYASLYKSGTDGLRLC